MKPLYCVRSFENGGPPPFIPYEKRNYKENREKVRHDEGLSKRKVLIGDDGDKDEGSVTFLIFRIFYFQNNYKNLKVV